MADQTEIHRLVLSEDVKERERAVEELKDNFSIFGNKEQAWADLHRLTQDKKDYVRMRAAESLGTCYSHIPEEYKKQAWDNLHRPTLDNKDSTRWGAADALSSCYSHIPKAYKKQKSWRYPHGSLALFSSPLLPEGL